MSQQLMSRQIDRIFILVTMPLPGTTAIVFIASLLVIPSGIGMPGGFGLFLIWIACKPPQMLPLGSMITAGLAEPPTLVAVQSGR